MKKLLLILVCLGLAVSLTSPVLAEDEQANVTDPLAQNLPDEMSPDQWNALKGKFQGKGTQRQGKHCCQPWMPKPLCKSGYQMVGYTWVLNKMVEEAWGKESPGPGGYIALKSRTLNQNGVCCCDEIKAATCDP